LKKLFDSGAGKDVFVLTVIILPAFKTPSADS
jgi:hypothetical protein